MTDVRSLHDIQGCGRSLAACAIALPAVLGVGVPSARWAVTMQGSSNVVIADNIVDNVIVYGNDQTVFYKSGAPFVWDRGRELGMTNRIDRVPA